MTDKLKLEGRMVLPDGEGAVVCTFVIIPVIWTALVVPMLYSDICMRSLSLCLGAAALAGLGAGLMRELAIGRTRR